MIGLEFKSNRAGAQPSTTFVGSDADIVITVRIDPPIEGIHLTGQIRHPDGSREALRFENTSAIFKLSQHADQAGKYIVDVTVAKATYRTTKLSSSFYYQADPPSVQELDFPV